MKEEKIYSIVTIKFGSNIELRVDDGDALHVDRCDGIENLDYDAFEKLMQNAMSVINTYRLAIGLK